MASTLFNAFTRNISISDSDSSNSNNTASLPTAYFLVLGPSRAGKSSFINAAVGSEGLVVVNHDGEHSTKELFGYDCQVEGRRCRFIDTPWVNGKKVNVDVEMDHWIDIKEWLDNMYRSGQELTGVIYVQDIFHRAPGPHEIGMLEEMCGRAGMKNVGWVSTKWDEVEGEYYDNADAREKKWMTERGGGMERLGSVGVKFFRHNMEQPSAAEIVKTMFENEPVYLECQTRLRIGEKRPDVAELAEFLHAPLFPREGRGRGKDERRGSSLIRRASSNGSIETVEEVHAEVQAYTDARDVEIATAKREQQELADQFWLEKEPEKKHKNKKKTRSKQRCSGPWRLLRFFVLGVLLASIFYVASPRVTTYIQRKSIQLETLYDTSVGQKYSRVIRWMFTDATGAWRIPTVKVSVGGKNQYGLTENDFQALDHSVESFINAQLEGSNHKAGITGEDRKDYIRSISKKLSGYFEKILRANSLQELLTNGNHFKFVDETQDTSRSSSSKKSGRDLFICRDGLCVPAVDDTVELNAGWKGWIDWRVVVALALALVALLLRRNRFRGV